MATSNEATAQSYEQARRRPTTLQRILNAPQPWHVRAAAVSIQVFLSGNIVFGKYAIEYFEPNWYVAMRVTLALPFLFAIGHSRLGKSFSRLPFNKEELPSLLVLAVLGVWLNLCMVHWALSKTSAVNASILVGPLLPVLVTFISCLLGYEKFHWTMALGGLLSVAGALVVIGVQDFSTKTDETLANLALVCVCLIFAIYLVILKRVTQYIAPMRATFWSFAIGLVFVLITAIATSTSNVNNGTTPVQAWLAVLYAAVIGTAYVYNANAWTFKHGRGSEMALYVCMVPVFTALLELVIDGLGAFSTWSTLLGGVLVATGLVVVIKWSRPLQDDVIEHPGDHALSMLDAVAIPLSDDDQGIDGGDDEDHEEILFDNIHTTLDISDVGDETHPLPTATIGPNETVEEGDTLTDDTNHAGTTNMAEIDIS